MPLGKNRRYNTLNGIPIQASRLQPDMRGVIASYSSVGVPVFIETEPKSGAGLPTGDDAEEYIGHFTGIFEVPVYADAGDAVSVGENLDAVVVALGNSYNGPARVGDLINEATSPSGITVSAFHSSRHAIVHKIVDGTTIAAGTRGTAHVMIGV